MVATPDASAVPTEGPDGELIFEIAYVEDEKGRVSLRNVESSLNSLESIRRKPQEDGSLVYQYHNPETEACCDFVVRPLEAASSGRREGGASLTCELVLPRPSFFALECLPLAVRVARELRMEVEVVSPPYDEDPFVPTVEDLMFRWQKANLEERDYLQSTGRRLYLMGSTELEAVWEYALLRRDMARRYSRTRVQVPPVMFWGDKSTHRALRVAAWPRLAPSALPYSDLIRLESPPSPLKEGAVYNTLQLVSVAGSLLKSLVMPVQHYLYDKESLQKELIHMIGSLPRVDTSQFVRLTYADVMDLDPQLWD